MRGGGPFSGSDPLVGPDCTLGSEHWECWFPVTLAVACGRWSGPCSKRSFLRSLSYMYIFLNCSTYVLCVSEDRLSYAAITNSPRMSAAWNSSYRFPPGLLRALVHIIFPLEHGLIQSPPLPETRASERDMRNCALVPKDFLPEVTHITFHVYCPEEVMWLWVTSRGRVLSYYELKQRRTKTFLNNPNYYYTHT